MTSIQRCLESHLNLSSIYKARFFGQEEWLREKKVSSFFRSRPKSTNSSCIMGDGPGQRLSSCSNFKALSVQERHNEVRKHGLGFSCLSPQNWLNSGSNQKQWGVNGCLRSHNALLRNFRNATLVKNSDTVSGTNLAVQAEVGSSTKQSSLSHTSSNTSVLLQVVPVTLQRCTLAPTQLDAGSTWNFLLAEASEKLGLDG